LHFLAMELVEGEDLAARIGRGAIPVEETLPLALQIASALEAAHERGVIHRDLKPPNIKVTPEGKIKVLDFGLAKAFGPDTSDPMTSPTMSPTVTSAGSTAIGVILGTAAYMSPEQAKGKPVDRRADIWSFGVVLLEMLTGRLLFRGESVAETIAAVLRAEPDLSGLPANTPPRVRRLIERCLRKDPQSRLRDIGDARMVVEEAIAGREWENVPPAQETTAGRQGFLPWILVAMLAVLSAVLGIAIWRPAPPAPPPPMMFSVQAPTGTWINQVSPSPDGTNLLLRLFDERGEPRFWVQSVATGSLKELAGTTNAYAPFWSPDGQWVGFFSRSKMFKVAADGGSSPIEIADMPNWWGSTDWGENGTILFSPSWDTPIYGVSDKGGTPEPITTLEPGESAHLSPAWLADGRISFTVLMNDSGGRRDEEGIYIQTPGDPGKQFVLAADRRTGLTSRGLVTYAGDPPSISIRTFDPKTLEIGAPTVYALPSQMQRWGNSDDLRIAALVPKGPDRLRTATWYNRGGEIIGTIGEPGFIESPAISPDETHVALEYMQDGVQEIRNYELRRGISISVHKSAVKWRQMWSPDGSEILFAFQTEPGKSDIVAVDADGTGGVRTLVKGEHYATPTSVSKDGQWLVFSSDSADDPTSDIWIEDLENPGKPRRLVESSKGIDESNGRFSPDARWVAYTTNESGREEVYVVNVESGKRTRVSLSGGFQPRWPSDQREIFYLTNANEIMAASVDVEGDELIFGEPRVLFEAPILGFNDLYDVTSDGQRFLVLTGEQYRPTSATILLNWFERPTNE
jgi:Tol biopolymer transport system component